MKTIDIYLSYLLGIMIVSTLIFILFWIYSFIAIPFFILAILSYTLFNLLVILGASSPYFIWKDIEKGLCHFCNTELTKERSYQFYCKYCQRTYIPQRRIIIVDETIHFYKSTSGNL